MADPDDRHDQVDPESDAAAPTTAASPARTASNPDLTASDPDGGWTTTTGRRAHVESAEKTAPESADEEPATVPAQSSGGVGSVESGLDPAPADPSPTDPSPTDPSPTDPRPVEPGPGEPGRADAEPADSDPADASADDEDAEPEWWEDPRMPWKGKPGRADLLCWGGFSLSGVYSLASLPFRPLLLANNPLLLCALTGSRVAVVTVGALTAAGRIEWWWLALILATLSVMKFDALFWWAGKLWGRGLIEIMAGRSARAARGAARAERLAARFGVAAILLTYVVPIVPRAVVYASVGATGMRLRIFLLADIAGSFATRCLYLYLGYRIGQPVVAVFDVIAKYSLYLSLALVVVVFVGVIRQQKGKAPAHS